MEFNRLPDDAALRKTVAGFDGRGIDPVLVEDRAEALLRIVSLIPAGASVMTGASRTLEEIGFVDLLISGDHPWDNLKNGIFAEQDPVKQLRLRRESTMADYFLGSVHAITEEGELLIASASGSQLPAYVFCASNVIWVAGTQKIVPDLGTAFRRVREYVFPLEDERMKSTGAAGSAINKQLIFSRESSPNRQMTMILVKEQLGF